VVVAAWQVLYTGLGYGVLGAAPGYLNPLRERLQFAGALAKNGPILLVAQWTGPPSETFPTLSPGGAALRWVGAMLILIVIGAMLAPLLRRDPVARFWALGQTLAVVPICAAVPHDRYLFFVGLGAMGLLAQFACSLLDREYWRTRIRMVFGNVWISRRRSNPWIFPPSTLSATTTSSIVNPWETFCECDRPASSN